MMPNDFSASQTSCQRFGVTSLRITSGDNNLSKKDSVVYVGMDRSDYFNEVSGKFVPIRCGFGLKSCCGVVASLLSIIRSSISSSSSSCLLMPPQGTSTDHSPAAVMNARSMRRGGGSNKRQSLGVTGSKRRDPEASC